MLILFLTTPGTVFIQKRRVSAQENQAVLIRPFEQHYYALPEGPILWLFITFELPAAQPFSLPGEPVPLTGLTLQTLDELLHGYRTQDGALCRLLLAVLLSRLGKQPDSLQNHPDTDPAHLLTERVNRYIHSHLDQPFTVRDAARHTGLSESHLRRRFRETMGIGLGGYIRRIRLDRAGFLLKTTRLTAGEIAWQCGFSSQSVFCRAFREQEGVTPSTFRKRSAPASNPGAKMANSA